MTTTAYMSSASWRELITADALGRTLQVYRDRPRSIGELLRLSQGQDDLDFLVQGNRRVTYADFRAAVTRGIASLRGMGVSSGDRIMIVLFNSCEFWLAQCVAWSVGAVPVLGNRWWNERDYQEAVARIRPTVVVTDAALATLPVSPAMLLPVSQVTQWWREEVGEATMPQAARADQAQRVDEAVNEDDVAAIVFTAGSTGAPKGVQLSHRVLVWTQQTLHVLQGGRPPAATSRATQKVSLMTTPMFHNGAMVAALSAMLDGNRIVIPEGKFAPAKVLELIEAERVTHWSAVPTMYRRVLAHPDLPSRDLSSLRAPATGGTVVSVELLEEIRRKLPNAAAGFSIGYGMTEMSFLTMATARDIEERPGTVGRALPSVELKILDPDADGAGEIAARSPALMVGYFGQDSGVIDPQGWYRTGDLGRIDDKGYLYLTGRSKDMVIRGGENISCQHVEAAIARHGDVREVAVVGYPDQELGEALAAFVHLRDGATVGPADLTLHSKQHLAYFEVPSRWILECNPLPVLPTGKIDKPGLARRLVKS